MWGTVCAQNAPGCGWVHLRRSSSVTVRLRPQGSSSSVEAPTAVSSAWATLVLGAVKVCVVSDGHAPLISRLRGVAVG